MAIPKKLLKGLVPGEEIIESPIDDIFPQDVSSRNVERMARGYIMGTKSTTRRKEIRDVLEEKVTKRIGVKGKYLVDKLFELIEGVYIIDNTNKSQRGEELRYYKVPPNLNAIIYALDRVLGKPKQHVEKSEEKKGIFVVEHIIKNLAGDTVPATTIHDGNERGRPLELATGGGKRGRGRPRKTEEDGTFEGDNDL